MVGGAHRPLVEAGQRRRVELQALERARHGHRIGAAGLLHRGHQQLFRAQVMLPARLLVLAGGVTLVTALLSGVWSLRSLRLVQPAMLLR